MEEPFPPVTRTEVRVSSCQNEQIKSEYGKHSLVPILFSMVLGSFAKTEGANPKLVDNGGFFFPVTDYTCLRRSQLFKMNAKQM